MVIINKMEVELKKQFNFSDDAGKDINRFSFKKYLTAEDILSRIEEIKGEKIIRDKAFIAFLYLSAARIEEVVYYILEPRVNKVGEVIIDKRYYIGKPLKKSDIEIFGDGDYTRSITILNVRCLKRREGNRGLRNISVYIGDLEKPFLKYLRTYLDTLEQKSFLFLFTRSRAWKILNNVRMHPHLLIHSRCTHLTTRYGYSPHDLMRVRGWTDTKPSGRYVHLDTSDLVNKAEDTERRKKEPIK